MNFSKSKYCGFWQCPKLCWLKEYKPEKFTADQSAQARFETGNKVGDLAMKLFGKYTDVTEFKPDKTLDLQLMIAKTDELIKAGAENICEASFDFNGLYCAVDILHKQDGGYAIYEVKSSTKLHYIYLVDIAYQKYVLQKCGVNVTGTYIVNINNKYVRRGDIDIHKLFKINDVSGLIGDEERAVEYNLHEAKKLLAAPLEPDIDLDIHCKQPYDCGFWDYCTQKLPKPSVFDLYRLSFKNKIASYKKGVISFNDIEKSRVKLNDLQKRQIDFAIEKRAPHIDREKIKEFLSTLSYPLYFLDFETMQPVIPLYDNCKPYEQIPFQYSLHYIETEDGELKHKEFLGISGEDSRRAIAESLCAEIPQDACVLAYNKQFECGRIQELAALFPDLGGHLLVIRSNIKDLLVPFENGYYYVKSMGGSFSIKSVLPALFPNDPSLDYHNLEDVHNGSDAMNLFPKIETMSVSDAEKARRDLLNYCKLDTFAMVKIWQELVRVSEEKL